MSSSSSNYNLFFSFLSYTISSQWSISASCWYIVLCCSFCISSFVILTDFPFPLIFNFLSIYLSPCYVAMSLVIVFKAFCLSFFFCGGFVKFDDVFKSDLSFDRIGVVIWGVVWVTRVVVIYTPPSIWPRVVPVRISYC